jgi:pyruvate,water dikinase
MPRYIRSFLEIGLNDVGLVGGKTASLGELYSVLSSQGVAVPNGFAVTADAYRDALSQPGVTDELHRLLDGLDKSKIKELAAKAANARKIIYDATDRKPPCCCRTKLRNGGGPANRKFCGPA